MAHAKSSYKRDTIIITLECTIYKKICKDYRWETSLVKNIEKK